MIGFPMVPEKDHAQGYGPSCYAAGTVRISICNNSGFKVRYFVRLSEKRERMILSDGEIKELLIDNLLEITPIEERQIQPASVDITLGNTFSILEDVASGIIDPSKPISYKTFNTERFLLLPGQFVLATTREYIKLPDSLTAFVEGRSSWGRLGLFIQNAGWVDPGFEGEITLELYNANRCAIELSAGLRIGQLVFAKMGRKALNPYDGKYQKQKDATGSKIFQDFDQ